VKTVEVPCCKDGRPLTQKRVDIGATGRIGLGIGGEVSVAGYTVSLVWEGPGLEVSVAGGASSGCGEESVRAFHACGTYTLGAFNELSVSPVPFLLEVSLQAQAAGSLQACVYWRPYSQPQVCAKATLCGSVTVGATVRYFGILYNPPQVREEKCLVLYDSCGD